MQLATRRWIIAGVAAVGASVVAVAPVTPPPTALTDIQLPEVALTAGTALDPLTAIGDVFIGAGANLTTIVNNFADTPFGPILHTVLSNPNVLEAVQAAISPFSSPDADFPLYVYQSLDPFHAIGLQLLDMANQGNPAVESLLAFAGSPASGLLLSFVGPLLDPALAVANSITDALHAPSLTAGLFDIVNIPANIADATVNGVFLDGTDPSLNLTPLLPLLQDIITFPSSLTIHSQILDLPGLLSAGEINPLVTQLIGSSLLQSSDLNVTIFGAPLDVPGVTAGPLASLLELGQAIASGLGFDFA